MKDDLRIYAKTKRKLIANKNELDSKVQENILSNEMVLNSRDILIYISKIDEVDTFNIISALWKMGKNVYVPKVNGRAMDFYLITSFTELKKGSFGIFEPTSNIKITEFSQACIIMPALLIDVNNNRLGYGGGFYDRYLENKEIYKIGICYSDFIVSSLPVDRFDVPVDEVVTEFKRCYRL